MDEETKESAFVAACNAVPHLLFVVYYHNGEDHDCWEVRCTRCRLTYTMSENGYHWGPDLNYCPGCCPAMNRANSDYIHTKVVEDNCNKILGMIPVRSDPQNTPAKVGA